MVVTTRDVQEIVTKLSSDKAKTREEGIKLLNTWLEGERSVGFCRYLSRNTAELKPDEIPNSETWPFLVKLLIQCISLEISSSKRRTPKSTFAKTLRIVVQKAEENRFSGATLPLLSVVKTLFSHINDVLSNTPSFQSEYGIMLRHLLVIREYRFHMRKRTYCSLMLLYMERVEESFSEKSSSQYGQKEEAFRGVLVLHSLLENPPGDFPNDLREDVVKGFMRIFSFVRDEGKLSRKVIECVNTFLLKDGPNLGSQSLELHDVVQQFVFHCWLTTRDRGLKDVLVSYARLQLNLTRNSSEGSSISDQLLDVVCRELDVGSSSSPVVPWSDATKDDKLGTLTSSQNNLVELSALVFYRACVHISRPESTAKRAKREHAASRLKEALIQGKWLWIAAFVRLIRNYYTRINKDLVLYWFEAICTSFQRILNDANTKRAYDGLLWTLRGLQELAFIVLLPDTSAKMSSKLSIPSNEFNRGWQLIWSSLTHGLATFSSVPIIVDAALMLLGFIILSDQVTMGVLPQDLWDHQIFKQMPSESVLYFTACYFSWTGSQGDLQENLRLRRKLLREIIGFLSWKGPFSVNERTVLLLPAAVFALCAGCASFIQLFKRNIFSQSVPNVAEVSDDYSKMDELERGRRFELFDCSIEFLTRIIPSSNEDSAFRFPQHARLPRLLRDPLLNEMEICSLRAFQDEDKKIGPLSEVFSSCAVLCYFIYGSSITRKREEGSSFLTKTGQYLLYMLNNAVQAVQENHSDLQSLGCLGFSSDFNEKSSVIASLRCLISSPVFTKWREQNSLDPVMYDSVIQSLERLLKSLAKLYEEYTERARNIQAESLPLKSSAPDSPLGISYPPDSSRIVDMELDVDEDSKDADMMVASGKTPGIAISTVNWKLGMISLISCFFSVLHVHTWDILFDLMEKECDPKVSEHILYNLCQHPYMSSPAKVMDLVHVIDSMIKRHVKIKLDCVSIVSALHCLVGALLSLELDSSGQKRHVDISFKEAETDQCFIRLGDMVNKVAEFDLLDWFGRVKLLNCICDFILLNPQIGQTMINRLLLMLPDPDYRVRFAMARRIGVLFQTWDGHEALFQDICSNFGVVLVVSSKEKVVTAKDVLSAGPQPRAVMETVIITLMHLAFHSEKIELEVYPDHVCSIGLNMQAVFMMCAISAIDPCQRELVVAALENLSRQLQYSSRFKYMAELMKSILFSWIAFGISLAALLEIRHFFVSDVEPNHFIRCCSQWLLPALLLHGDNSNLSWVAKIAGQPLALMVKEHFVPIFSVCMALHCSKKSGSEKGATVLQSSIFHLGEITENERDKLIKKNMVSVVSHILSLASCASEPIIPSFSCDTVASAVKTVVDGFLEMDDSPMNTGVIDKINIFRPDRVFSFIVEMHYRIAAASHYRHKRHYLAAVEVLTSILGHRATVASTFNYLLNLIGQYIGCLALQDQCCCIISCLLDTFKSHPSKEIICVLGDQLQFLVSKLVTCISSEANAEPSGCRSSQVLSLLQQLVVDSDPSLHDYVRELEPFPETDIFREIHNFHMELCQNYSPRDHLLKCARRSCYLPPRLLSWSLQALHKKLMAAEASQREKNVKTAEETNWHSDNEIVHAVWTLVHLSSSDEANSIRSSVSDFVSRVGIGDPHCVVFHLPGEFSSMHISKSISHAVGLEFRFSADNGISDEILIALLKVLKKYLMDDSVKIVDMTSQTLRGILSTERGQRVLSSFDCYEQSLIKVHAKGINLEVVEKVLFDHQQKFTAAGISLEKSAVWSTHDKTFETWICYLVYSLIGYCEDVIIRLCQDIALLKAEIAELLLPSVIVNLSGRKNLDIDLHKLISSQVKEHIFTESNKLVKSVQIMLNALNELRTWYVMERSASTGPTKTKGAKLSSDSSRSRPTSARVRDVTATSSGMSCLMTTSSWDKVYWLSIDYLLVAKSAVVCGAYFTSFMYVEHWCEEHFNSLTLGDPDFSHLDALPEHVEILVSAITRINEPDSLYGVIQSNKLTSQIITFEHEGNWSKALEYYDLQVRSETMAPSDGHSGNLMMGNSQPTSLISHSTREEWTTQRKPYKGLIRSLQQTGCMHVLDLYCRGLTSWKGQFQHDAEFTELQYEAAWRAGNWDFSLIHPSTCNSSHLINSTNFNENLHCCLRALQEGDTKEFHGKLKSTKKELVWSISHASEESTEFIYSTVIKLQILYHLGLAWDLRWMTSSRERMNSSAEKRILHTDPLIPTMDQLLWLNMSWNSILEQTQLHMNLLEPFIAFRRILLQILGCKDCTMQHLLQSASTLRKGSRFSQAAASLHEFKFLCVGIGGQYPDAYWLGRLEEAKLLRAQGQYEMAISLANYILQNYQFNEDASDVYRLVGKWLAETRSSNSRTILEKYLKPAVAFAEDQGSASKKSVERQSQTCFHLAHYADALFKSYEERLSSNEWQAAMRLRKHKTMELEALIRRLKSSAKGDKTDYSLKIQELQKQLAMDKEEAIKLQDDRDNFLKLALEGYKRCLEIGDKYDVRVVFRLVSLWFSLSAQKDVIDNMRNTIDEVQSYKFVPLVYQIASRMGSSKDGSGSPSFQLALVCLVRNMAIDHPYHTIFQLLALANGDRIKDKQRSRNSYVVDMDKKRAAEELLLKLSKDHGPIIVQMKQMVEVYIKLAELDTRREDTNRRVALPREIRSVRQLELVPVVTATFPVDRSCQYREGSFPYFKGLSDSVTVMNGINAPKVVECFGSDGRKYKQLAKSGNDDLRQDAVMEQFFGLVNTFLQNHRDTWKRRLGVRTYKVVPFTPSAGVLEWVDGTIPLGEYLIGSSRNGGAHGKYGIGDWSFAKCREHMSNEKDKRKAFQEVCDHFRPVMHYFFLEKFLQPADWFEKRLAYTRSVAASSMVGYIVGLGDRHAMNILIDQSTAEVVHIDLGVAFEQGLMLKTPERVPFRLTRDIIDGMGVTGVEGVFRRCSEETLSVMRTNKEALLTIVEVFIHDPLYKWALSPLKALQRQKDTDDDEETSLEGLKQEEFEGNKDAARALMRVKQKLDGYEEGELRSIHGQVQQLIQDAIDPDRLCQMFPGWGAWM